MSKNPTYEELKQRVSELEKQKKLLQSEAAKYKTLFDSFPLGISVSDSHGNIVEANSISETLLDISKEEHKKRDIADQEWRIIRRDGTDMPPDEWASVIALKEKRMITGSEMGIVKSDGQTTWINVTAAPLQIEGYGVVVTYNDITKNMQAEAALRQSEEKYRKLYEDAAIGIFHSSFEGRFLDVNPALAKMLGYETPQEVVDSIYNIAEQIYVEPQVRDEVIAQSLAKGESVKMENLYRRKDGSEWNAYLYLRYVSDSKGQPICLEGFVEDITERKEAEKALRESEERFRILFNSAAEGILVAEIKSKKFHFANPAICQMLGYSEDELIGMHVTDIHPEESLDHVISEFEAQARGGKVLAPSIPCCQKDGQIIYADVNTRRANINGVKYNIGLFTNITERKQAEEALLASEEKYRSIMDAMKDSVYICSSDLRIEYMNPRSISRVGWNATGEYCYKTIFGSDEKCPWCKIDNILHGEHADYELADPKVNRYYSITNSPICHSDETISNLTILRDITHNKSIEAQLNQARKMESVGTMAGGIAHNFNNELYVITGNAELAMDDIPEWNRVRGNLEEIKFAALRSADLVKQLLNFSRQTDQELSPIGAVTVIKDALRFLRSTIPASIEIRQNFPDTEVTILSNPTQINQAIMNLCINASQAMEETGGILDIGVEKITLNERAIDLYPDMAPGDWLKIMVRDTGPGIMPDIIDRIFDPYFTTKEIGKGSGMGLAVVHGIVKNHHGTVSVDSKPGNGAAFTILFPVITERAAVNVKTSDTIFRGAGEKILFVDDEVSIAKMTGKMLERIGYRVRTKTSPVDALELFQSETDAFDLVITDMTMPKMSGVRLSEKLKAVRPDIPVIICTGHSALIDEEKARAIGIDGYAMKPITIGDIAKIIRDVLNKKEGKAEDDIFLP